MKKIKNPIRISLEDPFYEKSEAKELISKIEKLESVIRKVSREKKIFEQELKKKLSINEHTQKLINSGMNYLLNKYKDK